MKKCPFAGVASALATPFKDGEIDYDAFRRNCDWQINMGVDALVVAGTTGEAATLAKSERRILAETCIDVAKGRVPVVVGCGSSDTVAAMSFCREAASIGADAMLVITPYCNKGTERGIIEHFKRVADAANGKSVILYNVPSRTGADLSFSQCKELSKIENIVGIKEAAANITKMTRLVGETSLSLYSGNDDMILPVVSLGGVGVISVLSNLVPAAVSAMTHAALDGDFKHAQGVAHIYAHFIELLFAETNPAPLKYAMSLLDLCTGEMRLPMGEIADTLKVKIKDEMVKLALL